MEPSTKYVDSYNYVMSVLSISLSTEHCLIDMLFNNILWFENAACFYVMCLTAYKGEIFVCVCVYICVCVRACVCVCMYVCMYVCMSTQT
jgi:hypothetical protein